MRRGASSDSRTINPDTDFGPRVSLLLNSLLLSSLRNHSVNDCRYNYVPRENELEDFIHQLWIIVLFGQDLQEFRHRLRQVFEISKALDDGCLGTLFGQR